MEPKRTTISLLPPNHWPKRLLEIPQPPHTLWIEGALPNTNSIWLTVVGSRKATEYGLLACKTLIEGLRGYPVVIVSGLALGIDACAHEAALAAGLPCVAVPGSGIDPSVLTPASHTQLAARIVNAGGCILSPFAPTHAAAPYTFPTRNRIMVGLSHAVLVIEAAEKSGTLITARMAVDYNRELGVVPGSIFAPQSAGPHQFLSLGATPVHNHHSLLELLGLDSATTVTKSSAPLHTLHAHEEAILKILHTTTRIEELRKCAPLTESELAQTITKLELRGMITVTGGIIRRTT